MKFIIITLFPEMFSGILSESILKRGIEKGLFEVEFVNLRDFGLGARRQVDDTPYGGGAGMVLRVDVVSTAIAAAKLKIKDEKEKKISGLSSLDANQGSSSKALDSRLRGNDGSEGSKVILLTPQGKVFNQENAKKFASEKEDIILVCGHYEGFDERVRDLVDLEISLGKFVLTGGEIPAMAIIDSVARLIPGVLGKEESFEFETFSAEDEIEYPQYTRPDEWEDKPVPEVLLSGNHAEIKKWRAEQSKIKSKKYSDKR